MKFNKPAPIGQHNGLTNLLLFQNPTHKSEATPLVLFFEHNLHYTLVASPLVSAALCQRSDCHKAGSYHMFNLFGPTYVKHLRQAKGKPAAPKLVVVQILVLVPKTLHMFLSPNHLISVCTLKNIQHRALTGTSF